MAIIFLHPYLPRSKDQYKVRIKMSRNKLALSTLLLLQACATATVDSGKSGSHVTYHSFQVGSGKEFSFQKSGCDISGGILKNSSSHASSGSYGTLNVSDSKSSAILDTYRVSCGAVKSEGKSACVIQRIEGDISANKYGGAGCPDMKFSLVNFRVF